MVIAGAMMLGIGIGLLLGEPGPGALIGVGLGLILQSFLPEAIVRRGQGDDE